MSIIDIVILIAILMFGLIGAERGVLKQLVTTVGFIIVLVLAFFLKNPIAEFLSLHLPFLGFSASSFNIMFYQAASFILVVIVLYAILQSIIKVTGVVEKILKATIILGIPSKILGFLVGLVEGFCIIFLILFFLNQPSLNIKSVNESKVSNKILKSTPILSNISKSMVDTINDIYDLKKDAESLSKNEIDLKSIDVMLEHKLITKDYVIKLLNNKKIEVQGIEEVLKKY